MDIVYRLTDDFEGWELFPPFIQDQILRAGARRVCEVGAGANPALDPAFAREHGIDCTLVDAEAAEFEKANSAYPTVVGDICDPRFVPPGPFDMVFSRMVFEHIPDARRAHANILAMLRPGGLAVHCFSTLYCVPFLVNRLVPDRVSDVLLDIFAKRDRYHHEKFPARYDWCRGPTRRQIARFRGLGYDVVEYRGYFGHGYYLKKLRPLHALERAKARHLARHPLPLLTSYATIILAKPSSASIAPPHRTAADSRID